MRALIDILATGVRDSSGNPLASGKVTTYIAGTSTPLTTYQDFAGLSSHTNPIILDADGKAEAYCDDRVKLVITTSADAAVNTIDYVNIDDDSIAEAITDLTAGDGLSATDGVFEVNVDDATIEISTDALRVKADGIGSVQLGNTAVLSRVGSTYNLGLYSAGGQDLVLKSAALTDLSATNVMLVAAPAVTAGSREVFSATANVTFSLDNCHWGLGTLGNRTDVELRLYAINDVGTLKWGISNKGGLRSIVSTSSNTAGASITLQEHMLVNTALSVATHPCVEVGWFLADFNDTGDDWTVQTGVGDLNVGIPVRDVTDAETVTMTTNFTNTTITAKRSRSGSEATYRVKLLCTGDPAAVTLNITLPSNDEIDTTKLLDSASTVPVGQANIFDSGVQQYPAMVMYNSTTSVLLNIFNAASTNAVQTNVTDTVPFTFNTSDEVHAVFTVPLLGWSSN
jgi:hypothetical protein